MCCLWEGYKNYDKNKHRSVGRGTKQNTKDFLLFALGFSGKEANNLGFGLWGKLL